MLETVEADFHLYTYHERIIRIVKARKLFIPGDIGNVKKYTISHVPGHVLDQFTKYGFSFSKGGFYRITTPLINEEEDYIKKLNEKLSLSEKYFAATHFLKSKLVGFKFYDDVYNRILNQEIEKYKKDGSEGNLLRAELECSDFNSYDALIEYINLKYEDASIMFAYIKRKDKEFSDLLKDDNFESALDIIKDIYNKVAY